MLSNRFTDARLFVYNSAWAAPLGQRLIQTDMTFCHWNDFETIYFTNRELRDTIPFLLNLKMHTDDRCEINSTTHTPVLVPLHWQVGFDRDQLRKFTKRCATVQEKIQCCAPGVDITMEWINQLRTQHDRTHGTIPADPETWHTILLEHSVRSLAFSRIQADHPKVKLDMGCKYLIKPDQPASPTTSPRQVLESRSSDQSWFNYPADSFNCICNPASTVYWLLASLQTFVNLRANTSSVVALVRRLRL